MWRHNAPQDATKATVISSRPRTMQDAVIPLRDPLGRSPNPYKQGWGNLHNSIGGSQQHHEASPQWTLASAAATLGGGHRYPSNARGNLHNLIRDPEACPELCTTMIELRGTTNRLGRPSTQEEQALGYQAPKSNKLLNFSPPRITVENSNRCN